MKNKLIKNIKIIRWKYFLRWLNILFITFSGFQSVCIEPDLQLKLSIFRESVRTKNISIINIDVFQREFLPEKNIKCHKDKNSFICPSETITRIYENHYPFFQIEKKCICDECQLPFRFKDLLNLKTKCMPVLENVPVLQKTKCEWKGIFRSKVVGCQCSFLQVVIYVIVLIQFFLNCCNTNYSSFFKTISFN